MNIVKLYTADQVQQAFHAGMLREKNPAEAPGVMEWIRDIEPIVMDSQAYWRARRDTANGRMTGHKPITPAAVVSAAVIATHTMDEVEGITYEEMVVASANGTKDFGRTSLPRMVCMYISYLYTDQTYPALGAFFGGRDHTSIMHGVKSVAAWQNTDKKTSSLLKRTLDILMGQDYLISIHEQKFEAYEKLTTLK